MPSRRVGVSRGAEAVGYAIDPKRNLMTPLTPLGDVDGGATDRETGRWHGPRRMKG
jgi:hypothetical protein